MINQRAFNGHYAITPHFKIYPIGVERGLQQIIYKGSSPPTTHLPRSLIMNRLPVRRHRRLLECLCQRRMRVTRPPHILTRCTILNR